MWRADRARGDRESGNYLNVRVHEAAKSEVKCK